MKPIGLTIPPNLLARADKVIRWACGDTTIEIDFSVDSIVSDITLMRRTVQEFFPGVGKFQLRRQPTSGFKYFQTFNPSNFRMKVGYLFGKLLRSR